MDNRRESRSERIEALKRRLRGAIRWLFEARRFKSDFGADTWKGGDEGSLCEISKRTYEEAVEDVLRVRQELDTLLEEEENGNL